MVVKAARWSGVTEETMHILIAPDSFKESLSAAGIAEHIRAGIAAADPTATTELLPVSDGGEGFVSAISAALDARLVEVEAVDALGRPARAVIAVAGQVAVLDAASVVGLDLIAPADRNIRASDTTGLGMLIRAALDEGARELIIGLGGTATNDGGAGMLADLGAVFTGGDGARISTDPASLSGLERADFSGLDPRLTKVRLRAACDVNNPLLGRRGASAIFGPQKGASPADVEFLDSVLARLASVTGGNTELPGAGAAGGLGFALSELLGAELTPGIDLCLETIDIDSRLEGVDLVFTGEGATDRQTLMGKAPAGVAAKAAARGIPVIGIAGNLGDGYEDLYDHGFTALHSVVPGPGSLEDALAQTGQNVERTVRAVVQTFLAGR